MSDIVVDSSVVAKWVLPEADSALAHQVIADVIGAGDRLIVLDLALPEVANAIWKQLHRGLILLDDARQFLSLLITAPIEVRTSEPHLQAALEIAAKYDRSIYDALFVALSHQLGLRGVTADEPLHSAVSADVPDIILLRDWR
jgi:predicted nucleic acid-binding protein